MLKKIRAKGQPLVHDDNNKINNIFMVIVSLQFLPIQSIMLPYKLCMLFHLLSNIILSPYIFIYIYKNTYI